MGNFSMHSAFRWMAFRIARHKRLKIHCYMCEAAQTGREGIRDNRAVQDGGGFIEVASMRATPSSQDDTFPLSPAMQGYFFAWNNRISV
jgi:hypothetical protein